MKNWHAVDKSFGTDVLYPFMFIYLVLKDMYGACTLCLIMPHILFHSLSSLYSLQQPHEEVTVILILRKRKLGNRELK